MAINTKLFDLIVVSTDSFDIRDTAIKYGAKVPFMRPENLSDDITPTAPVLEHAIKMLEADGIEIEEFCCIYPTAPFVSEEYINRFYESRIY